MDARGPADPTTDNVPVVRPEEREGGRLFGRSRSTEPEETAAAPPEDVEPAGNEPPEQKQE